MIYLAALVALTAVSVVCGVLALNSIPSPNGPSPAVRTARIIGAPLIALWALAAWFWEF